MKKLWADRAWDDYLYWQTQDKKTLKLFYLNKGKWNGKQILSEKWIAESTKAADVGHYGYLFWRGEYDSFRADGKYSQISMILPQKNAVVSFVFFSAENPSPLSILLS